LCRSQNQPDEIEAAAEEDEVQALPVSLEPAELWHRLVGEVDRVPGRQHLRSCMQELSPISFRDGVLLVGFDADVPTEHVAELQRPDSLVIMEKCFTRVSPVPHSRVVIKRRLDDPAEGKSRLPRASPEVRARVEKNPFVQRVCQVFSGKVIEVRG
jgi:hypothetical protein